MKTPRPATDARHPDHFRAERADRPSLPRVLDGALRNLCPRCGKTKVFHIVEMRPACPECGYVYEREPGYFVGAMVFSYAFSALTALPVIIVGIRVLEAPAALVIGLACLEILLLAPFFYRFSRLLWIHMDYRLQHDL